MCTPAPDNPNQTEQAPILIGKVSQVYKNLGFVLVQYERHIPIPEKGTILLSQDVNGDRKANLAVSGERLRSARDFPADINSGEVKAGDHVFIYESLESGKLGVTILDKNDPIPLPSPGNEKQDLPLEDLPQKENLPVTSSKTEETPPKQHLEQLSQKELDLLLKEYSNLSE